MVENSKDSAKTVPSVEGAVSVLNMSQVLFALGELIATNGNDFSVNAPPALTALPTTHVFRLHCHQSAQEVADTAVPAETVKPEPSQHVAKVSAPVPCPNPGSDVEAANVHAAAEPTATAPASDMSSLTARAIEDFNAASVSERVDELQTQDPAVRWYAVTAGLSIGVFMHWPSVAPLVVGVSGACYARYGTYYDARSAFMDAIARGAVRVIHPPGMPYPALNLPNGGHGGNQGPFGGEGTGGGVVA